MHEHDRLALALVEKGDLHAIVRKIAACRDT